MFDSFRRALRDAHGVWKRARNTREVARALLPAHMQKRVVLNDGPAPAGTWSSDDSLALATEMRMLHNQLQGEAIDDAGRVAYAGLGETDLFVRLQASAHGLHAVGPTDFANDDQRHAFWINLYNVLAIHGVIALGIEESVMEIPSFFARVSYRVGRHILTLDDMENGVLRRNAPHPVSGARLFGKDDARLAFCVERVDPRIHAALVCASTSCPPVSFYDSDRIDAQLDAAAENYVASEVAVEDGRVLLPITFRYYAADYTIGHGDIVDGIWSFLLEHARGSHRDALAAARTDGRPFAYRRYDWSLNGTSGAA